MDADKESQYVQAQEILAAKIIRLEQSITEWECRYEAVQSENSELKLTIANLKEDR